MKLVKQIPNLLTLSNLLSGCFLVYLAVFSSLANFGIPTHIDRLSETFLILLCICLVADLLDGMLARMLHAQSPIGLQLDSLADMVSFGVFPGFLMVNLLGQVLPAQYMSLSFCGLIITLFSALRLAVFNTDDSQTYYFKGLATPANALLIFGIYSLSLAYPIFFNTYGIYLYPTITLLSSLLVVSRVPLFSFKIKSFSFKQLLPQVLFLIGAIVLIFLLKIQALAPIILFYILVSLAFRKQITA